MCSHEVSEAWEHPRSLCLESLHVGMQRHACFEVFWSIGPFSEFLPGVAACMEAETCLKYSPAWSIQSLLGYPWSRCMHGSWNMPEVYSWSFWNMGCLSESLLGVSACMRAGACLGCKSDGSEATGAVYFWVLILKPWLLCWYVCLVSLCSWMLSPFLFTLSRILDRAHHVSRTVSLCPYSTSSLYVDSFLSHMFSRWTGGPRASYLFCSCSMHAWCVLVVVWGLGDCPVGADILSASTGLEP